MKSGRGEPPIELEVGVVNNGVDNISNLMSVDGRRVRAQW